MEQNHNLLITKRILELASNKLEYSSMPKECRKEYIFLPNVLHYALVNLERDFNDAFKMAVANYKNTLKEKKGFGWFHNPETLCYTRMQINQILYLIYGDKFIREIKFKDDLKNKAYKDLILQIDPTALMNAAQLKAHQIKCNKIAIQILSKIEKEEKRN